jgi:cell division septum initiation protein DivIVA
MGSPRPDHAYALMDDYEVVAQELSDLGEKLRGLEDRVTEVERVNARLEDAALSTARALGEVSRHWDAVYDAMRRVETVDAQNLSERDNEAARARRS